MADYVPDAKKHFIVSMIKSALRMLGYACMIWSGIPGVVVAGWFLVVAEIVGIIEELV